jgi:hypothetical protein
VAAGPRLGARRSRAALATLLAAQAAATTLRAQDAVPARPRPVAVVTRLPLGAGIVLDGDVSDPAWALVPPLTGLRTRVPVEDGEPGQRTEFRVAQDGRALWIAASCFDDAPGEIRATQRRRDADLDRDDRVELVLDTAHDHSNGYFFEVGAAGGMKDALLARGGDDVNTAWDGVWDARVQVNDRGWFAELRIPFRTLAIPPESTTWGFNIRRVVRRTREEIHWASPWQDSRLTRVPDAGELAGFTDLSLGLGLDFVPYFKAGSHTDVAEDDTDLLGTAGGDLYWKLTPGLTGALTLNTDFSETEVDERVVNLTRFPVFFPEKRKFFLQDAGVFTFETGTQEAGALLLPFFSRRIGLDDEGNPLPIDAGAKLSGFEGPWSLGVLAVQQGQTPDSEARDQIAARVRRSLSDHTTVGVIVTSGAPGADPDNNVVGADWRWTDSNTGIGNLDATAFALSSRTEGQDGRTGAYGAEIAGPNDLWNWRARARQIGTDFNPALGFVDRTGIREGDGELSWNPRPGGAVRQWSLFWQPDLVEDLDGHLATRKNTAGIHFEFEPGDEAALQATPTFDRVDEDFEIVPGLTVPADRYEYTRWLLSLESAGKRPLLVGVDYGWGGFNGGTLNTLATRFDWRPGGALVLGADYETDDVDLPDGEFVVRLADARVEVNFTTRISWQNLVQYDNVSRDLGWNSRLRWTLQPGDDLWFVLNQGWTRTTPTGTEHEALVPTHTDLTLKVVLTFSF